MSKRSIASTVKGSGRYARVDRGRIEAYRWEWANRDGFLKGGKAHLMSRDAAKGFARLCVKVGLRRLAAKHGLSAERVAKIRGAYRSRFTKEDVKSCCAGINGTFFARWGWTPCVIAHEVAHWLDMMELAVLGHHGTRKAHGPHWLGWFVFLLEDVAKVDRDILRASLIVAKLRHLDP